jgi:hypothetical protein
MLCEKKMDPLIKSEDDKWGEIIYIRGNKMKNISGFL